MIAIQTSLNIVDNTGAKRIVCIHVLGGSKKRYARVGDEIVATVKEAAPNSSLGKGQVVRAVVVRTKKELRRVSGAYIRFDNNAAVLIDKQRNPMGTRIFGPIPRELRARNFTKIISLAPEVV